MSTLSEDIDKQEVAPPHLRPLRLPLVRMVVMGFLMAGVVACLGGLFGVVAVRGAEWWWAPAAAACSWLGGVVGLLMVQGWAERTPVQWAGMLFLGQFVSLLVTGLLVWGLLYSSPQPSPSVVLPTVSVSFVMVWIAFVRAYGVSLRAHTTVRGL